MSEVQANKTEVQEAAVSENPEKLVEVTNDKAETKATMSKEEQASQKTQ